MLKILHRIEWIGVDRLVHFADQRRFLLAKGPAMMLHPDIALNVFRAARRASLARMARMARRAK